MTHVLFRHVSPLKFVCSQVLHTNPFGSLLRPVRRNKLPPIFHGLCRAPNSGPLLPMRASLAHPKSSSVLLLTHFRDGKLPPLPSNSLLASRRVV